MKKEAAEKLRQEKLEAEEKIKKEKQAKQKKQETKIDPKRVSNMSGLAQEMLQNHQ